MAAGFSWSMKHDNNGSNNMNNSSGMVERLNFATKTRSFVATSDTTCQTCGKVFMSSLSLINHVTECHVVEYNDLLSRISQKRNENIPHISHDVINHPYKNLFPPSSPLGMASQIQITTTITNPEVAHEATNNFPHANPHVITFESAMQFPGEGNNNNNNIIPQQVDYVIQKQPLQIRTCPVCDKVFVTNYGFYNHIESHMVESIDSLSKIRKYFNIVNPEFPEKAQSPSVDPMQPNFLTTPSLAPTTNINDQALLERRNRFSCANPRFIACDPVHQPQVPALTVDHFNVGTNMSPHHVPPLKIQCQAKNDIQVSDNINSYGLQLHTAENENKRFYPSQKLDLTLKL